MGSPLDDAASEARDRQAAAAQQWAIHRQKAGEQHAARTRIRASVNAVVQECIARMEAASWPGLVTISVGETQQHKKFFGGTEPRYVIVEHQVWTGPYGLGGDNWSRFSDSVQLAIERDGTLWRSSLCERHRRTWGKVELAGAEAELGMWTNVCGWVVAAHLE